MELDIIKKEKPYILTLLAIFILNIIIGLVKIERQDELIIFLFSAFSLFTYSTIIFYLALKYWDDKYDKSTKIKKITKISTITTTTLSLIAFILYFSSSSGDMAGLGIIYLPIYLIVGTVIGLFVGLVFSVNTILKTNLKIVLITTVIFFILPVIDLVIINQGIEELSWISMFGFFVGTFLAILFTKGKFPKAGPILGCLITSIPMIIDFLGITQAIRSSIGYNLWILYILPIFGLLAGYWVEKSLTKETQY